ncbi:MAG: hypothetical protein ACKVHE_09350 [Planctomycetales bacterium]|jgi:hypothetical protein
MNDQHPSPRRSRILPLAFFFILLTVHFDTVAFGQVGWTDQQFDQYVFQQYGNASTARVRLKESLELFTEDVDLACGLSNAQKQKLRLAGQGDIERFFRKFDKVKTKFQAIRNDQQKVNQIFQDISPLQTQLASGLFDRDSLLQKSLVNTINREQFLKYLKVDEERQRFHHEAKIGITISLLDQAVPVTAEQRRKLTELLRRETKPPRKSGRYGYYVMMHQVSKIDDKKFKPILDTIQWQVFNQQLAQMRGMEKWLKQNGFLSDDDDADVLLPDEQAAAK